MTLELSVLIGLAAVVVCALKGRYWWALGALAALSIGVVGSVTVAENMEEDVLGGLLVVGVPLIVAFGALWLATQPPVPGSYWSRLRATDEAGTRLIEKERGGTRFGRSRVCFGERRSRAHLRHHVAGLGLLLGRQYQRTARQWQHVR